MPRDGIFLGISERVPPSNMQAEQALLGALMANNRAYEQVADFLRPEHFADAVHGTIYAAIARRVGDGRLADAVTLKPEFEHSGALDPAGGIGYLGKLLGAMISTHIAEYGRTIYETWLRRELIDVGESIINDAFIPPDGEKTHDQVGAAMGRLIELGDAGAGSGAVTMDDALADAMAGSQAAMVDDRRRGLLTGIATLDRMWRGLWPGSLDILGARAETGKTALGMQILIAVADRFRREQSGEHVLFFSLEMPRADIGVRMLAMETGISADDIRCGNVSQAQAEALVLARKRTLGLPIIIDDRAGLTLPQIVLQARGKVRQKRTRLIVIDHLHRIRPPREIPNRTEQVAYLTASLKDLARSLNVPVLLLAQLSRANERRDDHRPTIADLMYAGEADADNILLLYRPELHMPQSPPKQGGESDQRHSEAVNRWHQEREAARGVCEAIFAKRRAGPLGIAKLGFDGPRTRFFDLPEAQ